MQEHRKQFPPPENGVDIIKYVDLYDYGKALMAQNNAVYTNYGFLSRKDGGPIQSQEDAPGMSMRME
jgi:hypothetical protein